MDTWLKIALDHPEWVATQKAAWEHWNKPESLGQPVPQFAQLNGQNLSQLPGLLAKHFQQQAQRHREAAQALLKISEDFRSFDSYEAQTKQEQLSSSLSSS